MNLLLWILQVISALLYTASGVMKIFLFDKISHDVPSFGALPKPAWMILGVTELACAALLVVPMLIDWAPGVAGVAASVLAVESVIFVWVHIRYKEPATVAIDVILGLIMAFISFGRLSA